MLPRKMRIAILTAGIVIITLIILSVIGFMFLKTDSFKSNEELFMKYFTQSFDIIDIFKTEATVEHENESKYTSELEGKIEYTENVGTSDENKNNPINDVGIKIKSNIDETNNYVYKDISIGTQEDTLLGLEYLKQNQEYGIRLNGVQQFVSSNNTEDEFLKELGLEEIQKILSQSKLNINSILSFTEEEKQNLANTFMSIIKTNVSKDKYYKQPKTLITIKDKEIETNSYYIKFTIEEYNNLHIKILEELAQNEIILSKIDLIENEIKNILYKEETNGNYREEFIDKINRKIEEIRNNNIGNDEVRITVYESNKKTVRISIEKNTNKLIIDLDNMAVNIDSIELGNDEKEDIIEIERKNVDNQLNILMKKKTIHTNEIINDIEINYQQKNENDKTQQSIEINIAKEKYISNFKATDNTTFVQSFENDIKLDEDTIELENFPEEQVEAIKNILIENAQGQMSNLTSKVNKTDYTNMFRNLGLTNKTSLDLPSEGQVSEIERKRFNSQFEFFASENLTTDNMLDLMKVAENNLEDIRILSKDGNVEELDVEKLTSDRESSDYIKTISEILIFIKEDSRSEDKKENVQTFLDKNKSNIYDVSIQYDDDGLVRLMRAKIHEKE